MKKFAPALGLAALGMFACAQEKPSENTVVRAASAAGATALSPAAETYAVSARARGAPAQYNAVNTSRRVLALTFDDGPHPELTPRLLDILRQKGVRATFFVIGRNVEAYPEIARRIVSEGHEIANHSWSHPALTSVGAARLREEIEKNSAAVERVTGRRPANMRPPYGAINPRVREFLTKDQNLDVILWSVDPLDWKRPGASVVAQRLIEGATPGGILLAHDIHPGTIEAMPETIAQLKAKGYGFVTVSQLLALQDSAVSSPASAQARASSAGSSASVAVP